MVSKVCVLHTGPAVAIVYLAAGIASGQDQPSRPARACREPAAAYVTLTRPGREFRIHSNCLDGSTPKVLYSETLGAVSDGGIGWRARLSPDGKRIAYKRALDDGPSPVDLLSADGKSRTPLIEEKTHGVHWHPDSKSLLYAPATEPPASQDQGVTGGPWGYNWRLLSLEDGRTVHIGHSDAGRLHPDDNKDPTRRYKNFLGWAPGARLHFASGFLWWSTELLVHDVRSGPVAAKELPSWMDHISAASQSAGLKTAAIAYVPVVGQETCRLAEITPRAEVRKLMESAGHRCEGIAWNKEHEIFYGKGTGPRGRIVNTETAPSGYYVLMSVYRYDLRTGRESIVLAAAGSSVYRFLGLLPGKALLVLNESTDAGRPRYILESRRLDGTRPVRLYEGDARPFFIGWIRRAR